MKAKSLLAVLGAMLLAGCSPGDEPPLRSAEAQKQIEVWVPPGTTLADAQRVMTSHRFHCEMRTNFHFSAESPRALVLLAARKEGSRLTSIRIWDARFLISQGRVIKVQVISGTKGLGKLDVIAAPSFALLRQGVQISDV